MYEHEDDRLIIPEEYKKMSLEELEEEEERMFKELSNNRRIKPEKSLKIGDTTFYLAKTRFKGLS